MTARRKTPTIAPLRAAIVGIAWIVAAAGVAIVVAYQITVWAGRATWHTCQVGAIDAASTIRRALRRVTGPSAPVVAPLRHDDDQADDDASLFALVDELVAPARRAVVAELAPTFLTAKDCRAAWANLKASALAECVTVEHDALGQLETFGFTGLARPADARHKTTTAMGARVRTDGRNGTWDFWWQLSPIRRERLARTFLADRGDTTADQPDQLAGAINAATGQDLAHDDAMAIWVNLCETVLACRSFRARRTVPSWFAGWLAPILECDGFDLIKLFDPTHGPQHVADVLNSQNDE